MDLEAGKVYNFLIAEDEDGWALGSTLDGATVGVFPWSFVEVCEKPL